MLAKKTPVMSQPPKKESGEWQMIPSFHRSEGFDTSKYQPPLKRQRPLVVKIDVAEPATRLG